MKTKGKERKKSLFKMKTTTTASSSLVRNAQHFKHIVGTPSRKLEDLNLVDRMKYFLLARSLLEK